MWIMPERTLLLFVLQAVGVYSSTLPGKDWSVLFNLALFHVRVFGVQKRWFAEMRERI